MPERLPGMCGKYRLIRWKAAIFRRDWKHPRKVEQNSSNFFAD
jgi:hypothetical protein